MQFLPDAILARLRTLIKDNAIAGRFEIERRVGAGGMGVVYRARDRKTGGLVAVKVLRARGEIDLMRFRREAELLAQLEHPAIVRYIASGITAKRNPCIVLEWLEGESVSERLGRASFDLVEALTLGARVADALEA